MLNQWWIDAGRILASENPRDKELDALRTQGFEIVLSHCLMSNSNSHAIQC